MGLDGVEFLLWVESHYEIEIPHQDASTISTVGDLARYISERLIESHGHNAPNSRTIFPELRHELSKQFRLDPNIIKPESRIVKDLGIN